MLHRRLRAMDTQKSQLKIQVEQGNNFFKIQADFNLHAAEAYNW